VKLKKTPKLSITAILERVGDVTRRRSNMDIAADLNCAPTTVSNWKGRGSIPWEQLYRFAHEHDVRFEWLLSGMGPRSAAADEEHDKTIERYEWIIDNLRKKEKRQK
jgi:hypothetical protein